MLIFSATFSSGVIHLIDDFRQNAPRLTDRVFRLRWSRSAILHRAPPAILQLQVGDVIAPRRDACLSRYCLVLPSGTVAQLGPPSGKRPVRPWTNPAFPCAHVFDSRLSPRSHAQSVDRNRDNRHTPLHQPLDRPWDDQVRYRRHHKPPRSHRRRPFQAAQSSYIARSASSISKSLYRNSPGARRKTCGDACSILIEQWNAAALTIGNGG